MHYIGIDLHKNTSQVCIFDESRDAFVERRVRTDFDGLNERPTSTWAPGDARPCLGRGWSAKLSEHFVR